MAKADPDMAKKERNKTIRWVVTIFFVTIFISGIISLVSEEIMADSSIAVAFLILLGIVLIGILFDEYIQVFVSCWRKRRQFQRAGFEKSIMVLRLGDP